MIPTLIIQSSFVLLICLIIFTNEKTDNVANTTKPSIINISILKYNKNK